MKLGEVISLEYGKPLEKGKRADDGKYPAYGANGEKCRTNEYLVDKPSIIVGRKGSAGEITLVKDKFWPLDVTYFVTFDETKYDLQFLYYLLLSLNLPKLATGVKPGINRNKVYSIVVNIPELQEQERIVAILDEAFEDIDKACELTEQNLKNARELFDSYLDKAINHCSSSGVTEKLRNLTTKIGSGATPRGGKAAYKKEGIALIRSLNVHDRKFKPENLALIDDDQAEKLQNVTLESGDVLLNITGASVARCCLVPASAVPGRVNQHVSILRCKQNQLIPEFLLYALTSKFYKNQLLGIGEAGSTRQAITKAQLESFTISFPRSTDEQKQVVEALKNVERHVESIYGYYLVKLDSLNELSKSLLQQAFSGRLIV